MTIDDRSDFYWHPTSFPEGSYGARLVSQHPVVDRYRPCGSLTIPIPKTITKRLDKSPAQGQSLATYLDLFTQTDDQVRALYKHMGLKPAVAQVPIVNYLDRVSRGAEDDLLNALFYDSRFHKVPLTPQYDAQRRVNVREVLESIPKSWEGRSLVDMYHGISSGKPSTFAELGSQNETTEAIGRYQYFKEIGRLKESNAIKSQLKPFLSFGKFALGYDVLGCSCMGEVMDVYGNLDWRRTTIREFGLSRETLKIITPPSSQIDNTPWKLVSDLLHHAPVRLSDNAEARTELLEKFAVLSKPRI
jgi:hypothetical protein